MPRSCTGGRGEWGPSGRQASPGMCALGRGEGRGVLPGGYLRERERDREIER